ncbi:MAG: PIN domain-containing protein, partial [Planctomycetaceae bacterium]|nr:PIN domain-containing protein [Planctomycetaceae bacterium]
LFSASLRDFLLHLATKKLVVPFWSEEIQSEWVRSLLEKRPNLKRENLERTCRNMNIHFPFGLVRGYEPIIPTLTLPDPDDRHVLAVAIHASANYIVTNNLKDFPGTALKPHKIEALSPDAFVHQLIQKQPGLVLKAAKEHRTNLSRPPKTADAYIATLEEQKLPKTVAFLRKHIADL